MPVHLLCFTSTLHQEYISFFDQAEKERWEAAVLAIKAESSVVFNKKETDGDTTEVRVLYENWMTHVKNFAEMFGENRTPKDIKWALNSAEEALGFPVTQWENPPDGTLFES